jgi:hypothetical protein
MKNAFALALVVVLLIGCQEKRTAASCAQPPAKHHHFPPHGGTPVVLGNEEYHLEFILNPSEGKLQAFVMDGELENFVRIPARTFEVNAEVAGNQESLVFNAVASHATGETVGDTSAFEAHTDWLKTNTTFDATLKQITVRTKTYQNVQFNFPKGNDIDEM